MIKGTIYKYMSDNTAPNVNARDTCDGFRYCESIFELMKFKSATLVEKKNVKRKSIFNLVILLLYDLYVKNNRDNQWTFCCLLVQIFCYQVS